MLTPNSKGKGSGGYAKRDVAPHQHQHQHQRRHGHHHFHKRSREVGEVQKRAECGMATATFNGEVKTWANSYNCGGGAGPTPVPDASGSTPPAQDKSKEENKPSGNGGEEKKDANANNDNKPSGGEEKKKPSEVDTSKMTGDWVRTAYYDAESQTAEGLVFLGNHGGQGSGVFD